MKKNEIVLFESKDGKVTLPVSVDVDTVWLSRKQMAELFNVTPQNITMHLKSIYKIGELEESATSKDFLLVQQEGGRSRLSLRRNTEEKEARRHGEYSGFLGESEMRQSHLHLLSQTVILSYYHTVILSNYKKMELFRC